VLIILFFSFAAQAAVKNDENAAECLQLEKKDADSIVNKIVPGGNAVDVKESPVKGVLQIDVEKDGQRGSIFLDCSPSGSIKNNKPWAPGEIGMA